ncbi:hypothetical protein [Exiguobacterium sp. ERU653]
MTKWGIRSDQDVCVCGFEEWKFGEDDEVREVWMLVQ